MKWEPSTPRNLGEFHRRFCSLRVSYLLMTPRCKLFHKFECRGLSAVRYTYVRDLLEPGRTRINGFSVFFAKMMLASR